jgi:hypothetical protein
MAIPISEYISIRENVVNAAGGIELTSLIITVSEMNVVDGLSDIKTAFDNGEVVEIDTVTAKKLFTATTAVGKMLNAYGAFKVKLFKKSGTNAESFNSVLEKDGGFGAFAIDDEFDASVATANETLGAQHMYVAATDDSDATNKYLLKVYTDEDYSQIGAVLGWAANINHTARNGATTLMYKDLGVPATVTTLALKSSLDAKNINYCGLVQYHGATRKFFQMGKCADGTDAGVVMSSIYMTASIENGWINLAMGANKIPANVGGAAMVSGIVISVAETAITNGAILCDKPLTNEQIALVVEYTNNSGAIDAIQSVGYYVDARIEVVDGDYVCEYSLVYAKGDHIAKVGGSHVLV